jgi:predicted nuclease with TOPRIM domain
LQLALQDTSKFDEYELRAKSMSEELARLNTTLRSRNDENEKLRQQFNYQQQELIGL